MSAQLSKAIAEFIEPSSSLPALPQDIFLDDYPQYSPKKCWYAVIVYDDGDIPRWHHRDMVNDPAMTAMLIEKLLRAGIEVTLILEDHLADNPPTVLDMEGQGIDPFKAWPRTKADSLGKVVALAFAQANGLAI